MLQIMSAAGRWCVVVPCDRADALLEKLHSQGIPYVATVTESRPFRRIWLGSSANLGQVQALLDGWFGPEAGPAA